MSTKQIILQELDTEVLPEGIRQCYVNCMRHFRCSALRARVSRRDQ